MIFNDQSMNEELLRHYADKVITALPRKWELYRGGDTDSCCSLVFLPHKEAYLFLSQTAIDEREHEIVLGQDEWGSKNNYPYDKIKDKVLKHFIKRLA